MQSLVVEGSALQQTVCTVVHCSVRSSELQLFTLFI
jgi:hypothetical protein